jgi:phytoene synthase
MDCMLGAREMDAAGIHGHALRAGYARCRNLNAEHGKTYYLATFLLPPAKRPFVHALYGFARYVDDLVDLSPELTPDERAERLNAWCDEFLVDLDRGGADDPVARAVIDTITRWSISVSYIIDFVRSMQMDLTVREYATHDDLATYMWGSAAVIGLQMLPILERRDDQVSWDELTARAVELGTAFQLTNFLRDIGEDLRRGRNYLPQDSMDRFGVDLARLQRGVMDDDVRALIAWEVDRARRYYAAARPGIALVHPTSRDCLQTAFTLYSEILDEIERADYDVFTERLVVSRRRRARVGFHGLRGALRARHRVPATGVPTA